MGRPVHNKFDPSRHCGSPDAGTAYRRAVRLMEVALKSRDKHDPQSAKWHDYNRKAEALRQTAEVYEASKKPCMWPKGTRTNHLGRGLCYLHCECKGSVKGHSASNMLGYYANLKDPEFLRLVGEMAVEGKDPRDLGSDILFLRAVLRQKVEGGEIDEAVKVTDILGKMVERENNMKLKQAVSWDAVTIMMERMAAVVKMAVTDPEVLNSIMHGWAQIQPVESDAKLQWGESGKQ